MKLTAKADGTLQRRKMCRRSFSISASLVLFGGCAERYDLGGLVGEIEAGGTGASELMSSTAIGELLVDGVEDGDILIQGVRMGPGVGDIDGDGLGDWIGRVDSPGYDFPGVPRLVFGGSRPAAGVLSVPEENPTFLPPFSAGFDVEAAGDVDGDGHADLVFGSSRNLFYPRTTGSPDQLELQEAERLAVIRDARQLRAHLWYGGAERSLGAREVADVGVAFGGCDELLQVFESLLMEPLGPGEDGYSAGFGVRLVPLGDMDGDGYADLALTCSFGWRAHRYEQRDGAQLEVATREREQSITHIYYGRGERFGVDALHPEPHARLDGVSVARALGDLNGDGLSEIAAVQSSSVYIVPGRPQRLSGTIALSDVALPAEGSLSLPPQGIGDLDQDGFDDLALGRVDDDGNTRFHLFYGSPTLLASSVRAGAAQAIFELRGRISMASLTGIGDWDGDGANDLGLFQALWSSAEEGPSAPFDIYEIRRIAGGVQRHEGRYVGLPVRSGAARRAAVFGPVPVGDVDGDGRDDLLFSSDQGDSYLKYGGQRVEPAIQ